MKLSPYLKEMLEEYKKILEKSQSEEDFSQYGEIERPYLPKIKIPREQLNLLLRLYIKDIEKFLNAHKPKRKEKSFWEKLAKDPFFMFKKKEDTDGKINARQKKVALKMAYHFLPVLPNLFRWGNIREALKTGNYTLLTEDDVWIILLSVVEILEYHFRDPDSHDALGLPLPKVDDDFEEWGGG